MGNKGFANRAKSGQKALPAQLKRIKGQVAADVRRPQASGPGRRPDTAPGESPKQSRPSDTIRVESYAGSRADETPRRFSVGDRTIEVVAVTSRSRTPDHAYFTVTGDDGQSYVLRHEVTTDRWTLA